MREKHEYFDNFKSAIIAQLASYVGSRSITHRYTDDYGQPYVEVVSTGLFRNKALTIQRVNNMKNAIIAIAKIKYTSPDPYNQIEQILRAAIDKNSRLSAEGGVSHRSYEQNKRFGFNAWSAFWRTTLTQSRANTVLEASLALAAKETIAVSATGAPIAAGRVVAAITLAP
ncbi:MAG: hypothetical protein A3E87_00900 [Gammaproteobacteria bacterium RIFCSPHIGHO2_12_FULL_35_23]|nr:MAG: hypothetical protein A3E87_00900 [Gammaproteobacteria bacterium RIFCSPHIGHO2_12_FULL_35_23]